MRTVESRPISERRHKRVRPVVGEVILLVIFCLLQANRQASSSKHSSEWNFDQQGLRAISTKFLCSHQQLNQSAEEAGGKQQVNVVTFARNQINSIEPSAFKCVASELRILVLTSNELTHVPLGAFESLGALQVLLLDNNQLSSIPPELALAPLKSLRHLDLADNRIESLDRWTSGAHLSGLISLNLAGNPLLQVHPSALRHLIKLKTLTLSRSSNESFAREPLEGLAELKFLHLDRAWPTRRTSVTRDLCRHSLKLSSLLLKSNSIERVPQFAHCQNLLLLDLSYNNIRGSLDDGGGERLIGQQLPNLIDLYLGNNQLESISALALIGLKKLQILELQNNRLKHISADAFLPVQPTLIELNLSHNPQLTKLSGLGLDQLKSLKCYGNNQLRELPHLKSAQQLALTYAYHCCDYPSASGNDFLSTDATSSAGHRTLLVDQQRHSPPPLPDETDSSELILWPPLGATASNRPTKRHKRNRRMMDDSELSSWMVRQEFKRIRRQHSIQFSGNSTGRIAKRDVVQATRCLPSPSAFLPCKDLFDGWWLRCGIWSVFLLAFLGNTLVIIVLSSVRQTSSSSALTSIMWLAHSKRHIDVPRFLVINLAIADLLMALYLGMLAFVDLSTLGEFKLYAIRWQYSIGCKMAGFLAVLSSELSVFILAIITLERNYAITNAVHLNRRLSLQKAMFIMFLGYAFALGMAVMPLYGVSDYRRFSVCLPLDVETSLSSQIYVITLISINTFSFLLLLGCYLRMYFAIRGSQAWNANDLRIAKRMSILVLTDFLCWMPIIASGLASLFGYHLVGTDGMKVLTIFILPLNSVANPFLYAITTKKFKRDLATLHRRTRALLRLDRCRGGSGAAGCNHHKLDGAGSNVAANFFLHNKPFHHHGGCCTPKLTSGYHANHHHFKQQHDLLLTSHKGRSAAATRAQRIATYNNRPATPLVTCSCRQQEQRQQHPRIVLESATQTIGNSQLLKKSRSTNSGLTMLAMQRNEDRAVLEPLSRVEESISSMRRLPAAAAASLVEREQEEARNQSPSSAVAGSNRSERKSLLSLQPARKEARSYLSVDPFLHGHHHHHLQVRGAHAPAAADIRSASACGQLASCRRLFADTESDRDYTTTANNTDDKCQLGGNSNNSTKRHKVGAGVSGSCDTVRVVCGGGSGGNNRGSGGDGAALKLSRSIQKLLSGTLAKAWSSIQISARNSPHCVVRTTSRQDPGTGADDRKQDGQEELEADFPVGEGGLADEYGHNDDYLVDDILMMSSPLKRSMRIGERRMSRSCDAIPSNNDLLLQLNSPSHSGQEQSSSHYDDDDQRVLLATINRLAAAGGGQRPSPAANGAGGLQPPLSRGARCTRCRSWSPALLAKLENCIYQMKSKFGNQNNGNGAPPTGATRLEQSHDTFQEQSSDHQQEELLESGASSESELELEGMNDDDDDDDEASSDDQFGELPDWILNYRQQSMPNTGAATTRQRARRSSGRLRQQSSITSDTLSTRTAGTLVTISSDSSASIQLAASSSLATVAMSQVATATRPIQEEESSEEKQK